MFRKIRERIRRKKEQDAQKVADKVNLLAKETALINNIRGIINHCDKRRAYFGWPSGTSVFAYDGTEIVVYSEEHTSANRASRALITTPSGQYFTANKFPELHKEIMAISFHKWTELRRDKGEEVPIENINEALEDALKVACEGE